jgi:heat-inducible transcriptional repressor
MYGRRELMLVEVVDRYIRTREPVSSRELVEEYGHWESSATVRNELAALEREGYLWKPYPSSGRIPTKMGFRHFAHWLLELAELRARPAELLVEPLAIVPQELPKLLQRTALLLGAMTGELGFVLAPPVETLRVVDLVMRSSGKEEVLVAVLSELGVVESRVLRLAVELTPEEVGQVEAMLAPRLRGRRLLELAALDDFEVPGWHDRVVDVALGLLRDLATEGRSPQIFVEGVTGLLRELGDQPPDWILEHVRGLLSLLRDERRFADLISELRQGREELTVNVGDIPELPDFSLVSASYLKGTGTLGVIGPLWLDYVRAFSATRYVTGRLEAILTMTGRSQEVPE